MNYHTELEVKGYLVHLWYEAYIKPFSELYTCTCNVDHEIITFSITKRADLYSTLRAVAVTFLVFFQTSSAD